MVTTDALSDRGHRGQRGCTRIGLRSAHHHRTLAPEPANRYAVSRRRGWRGFVSRPPSDPPSAVFRTATCNLATGHPRRSASCALSAACCLPSTTYHLLPTALPL